MYIRWVGLKNFQPSSFNVARVNSDAYPVGMKNTHYFIALIIALVSASPLLSMSNSVTTRYYAANGSWGSLNEQLNLNEVHFGDTFIRLNSEWHPFWGFDIDWSNLGQVTINAASFNAYALINLWGGDVYLSDSRGNQISQQPRGSAIQGMQSSGDSVIYTAGQWSSVDLKDDLSTLLSANTVNQLQLVIDGDATTSGNGNPVRLSSNWNNNPDDFSAYLEVTYTVPEPTTYALVVGCLALSSAFLRRRFKS